LAPTAAFALFAAIPLAKTALVCPTPPRRCHLQFVCLLPAVFEHETALIGRLPRRFFDPDAPEIPSHNPGR